MRRRIELKGKVRFQDNALEAAINNLEKAYQASIRSDDGMPKRIGKYEVLGVLGSGGMAQVYRVKPHLLNQPRSLKVLKVRQTGSSAGSSTQNQVADFIREANALAKLKHPNIAEVHDFDTVPDEPGQDPIYIGKHFLVSDIAFGGPLDKKLSELTIEEIVDISLKVCDALSLAHQNNIVHRDIKPANILLDEHNNPIVTDFGLAKRFGKETTVDKISKSSEEELMPEGTPGYMPPEQILSPKEADHRADIYSLGALLYETLTGQRQFSDQLGSENLATYLGNIITRRLTPILNLNPNLNTRCPRAKDLAAIVEKCMEKEQADRYQSMQELSDDLMLWREGRQVLARKKEYTRKENIKEWWNFKGGKKRVAGVAASAAVAVGLLLGYSNLKQRSERLEQIAAAYESRTNKLNEMKTAFNSAQSASKSFTQAAFEGTATNELDDMVTSVISKTTIAQNLARDSVTLYDAVPESEFNLLSESQKSAERSARQYAENALHESNELVARIQRMQLNLKDKAAVERLVNPVIDTYHSMYPDTPTTLIKRTLELIADTINRLPSNNPFSAEQKRILEDKAEILVKRLSDVFAPDTENVQEAQQFYESAAGLQGKVEKDSRLYCALEIMRSRAVEFEQRAGRADAVKTIDSIINPALEAYDSLIIFSSGPEIKNAFEKIVLAIERLPLKEIDGNQHTRAYASERLPELNEKAGELASLCLKSELFESLNEDSDVNSFALTQKFLSQLIVLTQKWDLAAHNNSSSSVEVQLQLKKTELEKTYAGARHRTAVRERINPLFEEYQNPSDLFSLLNSFIVEAQWLRNQDFDFAAVQLRRLRTAEHDLFARLLADPDASYSNFCMTAPSIDSIESALKEFRSLADLLDKWLPNDPTDNFVQANKDSVSAKTNSLGILLKAEQAYLTASERWTVDTGISSKQLIESLKTDDKAAAIASYVNTGKELLDKITSAQNNIDAAVAEYRSLQNADSSFTFASSRISELVAKKTELDTLKKGISRRTDTAVRIQEYVAASSEHRYRDALKALNSAQALSPDKFIRSLLEKVAEQDADYRVQLSRTAFKDLYNYGRRVRELWDQYNTDNFSGDKTDLRNVLETMYTELEGRLSVLPEEMRPSFYAFASEMASNAKTSSESAFSITIKQRKVREHHNAQVQEEYDKLKEDRITIEQYEKARNSLRSVNIFGRKMRRNPPKRIG